MIAHHQGRKSTVPEFSAPSPVSGGPIWHPPHTPYDSVPQSMLPTLHVGPSLASSTVPTAWTPVDALDVEAVLGLTPARARQPPGTTC
ncbi:hypothetical protein QC761_0052820 [Podospora bellae-mahoneyi]|uniref:Uncharacterized protein n=1 Tax=Podospora bellae-mahoneyi TaxID=2093777 RepID=A0ABR0FN87_9PEZI|nr:hypothetical protein QC761_0052820 [Podospora bellae-mahoneyi]